MIPTGGRMLIPSLSSIRATTSAGCSLNVLSPVSVFALLWVFGWQNRQRFAEAHELIEVQEYAIIRSSRSQWLKPSTPVVMPPNQV